MIEGTRILAQNEQGIDGESADGEEDKNCFGSMVVGGVARKNI